ncbi:uncharacterized protein A1O9_02459 [Exophiala aquamarina CBS 119918]|uniref:FAD-binding FR-type domain-containing protein n=1 Tax=Exophiala aquamarina CBS 119918 TaxID=1182545 RepID=A0A072PZ48_9EURO|nr:uncharacterized protein A1O9_02459 [Exophiala aquamarina CBS 119918]KEF60895.1 hypothetical protein A1O9_02459 [Exophiala aquamarina CBS 119918]
MDKLPPVELSKILRLSLKPTATLVTILEETGGNGQPPSTVDPEQIRRIIIALLWHRKFILTYYFVIGSIVAISCLLAPYQRALRWHRKRQAEKASNIFSPSPKSAPTSSSSTIREGSPPPSKNDAERTPLIPRDDTLLRPRPAFSHRLKAFLVYQPRPIRALTSRVNVLPDNATTVSILFFAGLNLFYLLFRAPLETKWIFILADRAGLLFVVNLPLLYLLAAKTNQPIKFLTGWSYEGLNMLHRRLGEWMIAFSVIHMFGMLTVWYTILVPLGYSFITYIASPTVYLGFVAILSYLIIYGTSTGWFRQLYYEAFLGLHVFFQFAALAFLFFHYPTAKPYVVATFLVWAIDRILWRSTLSSRKFIATLEVAPDEKTVLVHCDIDLQQRTWGIRAGLHHGWQPGQHLFLTVPCISFKHRFQTHPFTIASPAPPENTHLQSWPLQLIIRSIDGFSLDLLNYARQHQHCEVILEGPHGGMEAPEAAHHSDRVCFVAGGSGIAVTYPLAWHHQIKKHNQHDAMLNLRTVYRDRLEHTPTVLDCGSVLNTRRFGHFWVRQDPRHKQWISIVPKSHAFNSVGLESKLDINYTPSADGIEEVTSIITHTFDTRRPGPNGGRPDMKTELWDWVTSPNVSSSSSSTTLGTPATSPLGEQMSVSTSSSISSRHNLRSKSLLKRKQEKICIVVSGPNGLVRDIRNVVSQLAHEGWNVEVWVEKFGW